MTRYYLTQIIDGAWKITKQSDSSGKWENVALQGIYQTWEEANNQPLSPLCFDPQPEWPQELGGEN